MQYRTMQLIAIVLISNSLFADEAISLSDKVDRTNYAIGQQIGQDFRKQNMDLDPEALSRGMNDGHAGKQPELKPAEMRELLVNLKRQITKDMKADAMAKMKHRQTEKQRRLKAGSEFLGKKQSFARCCHHRQWLTVQNHQAWQWHPTDKRRSGQAALCLSPPR